MKYPCVSLFSGCGGLDLGLQQAGFESILALDNDPTCEKSYAANFPGVPFYRGSVGDLTPELAHTLTSGRSSQPIALLAGGPPCPPFSKSRFYRREKPRALKDANGWATLNGYLQVLDDLRPAAFLLENVPGLAYRVHNDALDLVLSRARQLGYSADWRILNAADYGVPQIRERCFVVGLLGDRAFRWPLPSHAQDPAADLFTGGLRPWRTAGEAIGDMDSSTFNEPGHFAGGRYHDLLREIPPGDNYLYFTEKRGHPNPVFKWRSRYWSFLLKLSPDLPAWTIQARRSNNMGPFHWTNRILTIAEIKRLQAFPDDWFLAGTIEKQWRQVGNAVPPPVAAAVGTAILDQVGERFRNCNGVWGVERASA